MDKRASVEAVCLAVSLNDYCLVLGKCSLAYGSMIRDYVTSSYSMSPKNKTRRNSIEDFWLTVPSLYPSASKPPSAIEHSFTSFAENCTLTTAHIWDYHRSVHHQPAGRFNYPSTPPVKCKYLSRNLPWSSHSLITPHTRTPQSSPPPLLYWDQL